MSHSHSGYGSVAPMDPNSISLHDSNNDDWMNKIDNRQFAEVMRKRGPKKPQAQQQQETEDGNPYPRPDWSFAAMTACALKESPNGLLPVKDIYKSIRNIFPFYRYTKNDGWKNSIRHCLSMYSYFFKMEMESDNGRKSFLWGIVPEKKKKLDMDILKFEQTDPQPISRNHQASLRTNERVMHVPQYNIQSSEYVAPKVPAKRVLTQTQEYEDEWSENVDPCVFNVPRSPIKKRMKPTFDSGNVLNNHSYHQNVDIENESEKNEQPSNSTEYSFKPVSYSPMKNYFDYYNSRSLMDTILGLLPAWACTREELEKNKHLYLHSDLWNVSRYQVKFNRSEKEKMLSKAAQALEERAAML